MGYHLQKDKTALGEIVADQSTSFDLGQVAIVRGLNPTTLLPNV